MKIIINAILLSVIYSQGSVAAPFNATGKIYSPLQFDRTSSFAGDLEASHIAPSDSAPDVEPDVAMEVTPEWSQDFKSQFSIIRVKIFPHNSAYNAPLGKDADTSKLTVFSRGDCKVYRSESTTSENGIVRDHILRSGKLFEFNVQSLTEPVWVECAAAITLKRPDYPTNPVSYSGLLFIKKVNAAVPYLTVVNVLPFEQYLKGVVPSEMPASWSLEVLKAQAVAARTYAYFELGTNVAKNDKNLLIEKSGAQIDDTVSYQAYLGLKNTTTATDTAVDETSGMVMTHENRIIKAYFHADSGGHTENSENVWGDARPYIIGKPEIYPEGSVPGSSWSYTTKISALEEKLMAAGLLSEGEELQSLQIDFNDLYPSTRPKFVELKLADGSTKKITAVSYAFATGIKSPWIKFSESTTEAQSVVVSGKGFGHGAGMNQWGAKVMIDKLQKKYDDVLKFYYTDIKITN